MPPSFYDSASLCYSTPWHPDEFYKVAKLNTDISEVTFSVPAITNEAMHEILGINTNTKETKKMKAKKCDRCGKLYENPVTGENCGAEVRFRYLPNGGDLISREALREDLRRFFPTEVLEGIDPKTLFAQIMHDIDNAPAASDRYYEGYAQGYIHGSTGADWQGE